ncbi:unnamed protein product [Cochlearia groenlandica]
MSLVPKFMLLLLLLFLNHHVDSSSITKSLPGFEGPLPFEIETGYIGIGEKEEIQSFYYFVESENNPKEDPLLVWLAGGPGCSSLIGLSYEIGPLTFKKEPYNGTIPTLVSSTFSWTKMANILFLDQPVGAGFSYSKVPLGKTSDTDQVNKIHEFFQKWLSKHPQFYSNPFYIGGDSYSGMIIPALVQKISTENYLCCEPPINLQGYILGNPITNYKYEINYRIPFAHGMSLISDELYESLKKTCNGNYEKVDSLNTECLRLVQNYHKCTDKINIHHILIPDCNITVPDCYYHFYHLLTMWANDETVREALHVRKGTIDDWVRCNRTVPYNNDIENSVPYHKNNSISGYKSLIFSGDHDLLLPSFATQAWIRSLNYSVIDDWRPWMIKDQIAGYTRSYANNMTFATVKASGHTPEYKPNETFVMFQRWINGQPLNYYITLTLQKKEKRMSFVQKFLLLLLTLFLGYHVDSSSITKSLPGFEGPLPFEIETGYIGIGEKEEVQSFYYFVESENNPKEDPVLIWLAGGPGCSSFVGLSIEIGPIIFKIEPYNGTIPTLVLTSFSWTKMANILFLDQPVGAGFSYSKIPLGKTSDTDQVNKIHEFLQKWLSKHPQFYSNPFYVAGDSYSGMIIPALVQKISKGNYICCEPPINLKGYILGNPITNYKFENNYRIPFAHGMALISNELYEAMKRICNGNYENVEPLNTKCLKLIQHYQKCTDKLNGYHILIRDCDITIPNCYYHLYYLLTMWANDETVREALHVRKGTVDEWIRCNKTVPYNKDIESSVPYHMNNSISGYKSLIFSGDHDLMLPFLATEAWIKSLNYSIIDDWRPWMINNQIAGYTRSYANKMTFATGGGHTPEYKPNETFVMFQRWIKGQPL